MARSWSFVCSSGHGDALLFDRPRSLAAYFGFLSYGWPSTTRPCESVDYRLYLCRLLPTTRTAIQADSEVIDFHGKSGGLPRFSPLLPVKHKSGVAKKESTGERNDFEGCGFAAMTKSFIGRIIHRERDTKRGRDSTRQHFGDNS